jgi:hypothetical protein
MKADRSLANGKRQSLLVGSYRSSSPCHPQIRPSGFVYVLQEYRAATSAQSWQPYETKATQQEEELLAATLSDPPRRNGEMFSSPRVQFRNKFFGS